MKIGILGGTFDPVHMAHLVVAAQACEQLGLESVLFIPAGEPWRKSERAITSAAHRLAMLRLAVQGNDSFGISDIELRRPGPSYTADTLESLAAERLDDAFWFIMGADALADLPNWRDPERIVRHARIAVAPRDREERQDIAWAQGGPAHGVIDEFDVPAMDISSTDIRGRVGRGASIRYLVPHAVEAYIREHGLYR